MYDFLSDKKPRENDTCFSYCLLNMTNYVVYALRVAWRDPCFGSLRVMAL